MRCTSHQGEEGRHSRQVPCMGESLDYLLAVGIWTNIHLVFGIICEINDDIYSQDFKLHLVLLNIITNPGLGINP